MPTELVLFDLDETLFDHDRSRLLAFRMLHTDYPCFAPIGFDQFERDFANRLEALWPRVMDGSMSIEERIAEAIKQLSAQHTLLLQDADCASMARMYRQTYLGSRQAIPGARELIDALKPHARLGIVTNNRLDEQVEKLKVMNLEGWYDFMVCSGELGIAKPDRGIFEFALAQAGCSAQDAVMVGDSWEADVIGAAGLGMRAVWLNRSQRPIPDPALAVEITSLEPADQIAKVILNC